MTKPENTIKYVDAKILEKFMIEVFIKLGVPEEDAEVCSDVLISADLMGIDSHGINRLKPIYFNRIKEGIQNPVTEITTIRDSEAVSVIDGNNGMGHVVAKHSMDIAISKAKKFGISMVAAKNSTHYGIAGYYSIMACSENMIGITGTNARPSIAPTFGIENMLGTNPLTIGIPSDEDFPFLIDCATSVTQRGKIEMYARNGKNIPEGWVIGNDGNSKTDSYSVLNELIEGKAALLPLGGAGEENGGYKGYGYALAVEILSAALQNGNFMKKLSGFDESGNKIPFGLGHFFIAINIENFIDIGTFKKITGTILRNLRDSEKMPSEKKIYTPGEKESIALKKRKKSGIPLNTSLRADIKSMIDELKISGYEDIL